MRRATTTTLYQVILPYALFGIEFDERDICRNAAPIGKWMVGKTYDCVEEWVNKKGGCVNKVERKKR